MYGSKKDVREVVTVGFSISRIGKATPTSENIRQSGESIKRKNRPGMLKSSLRTTR